MKNKHWRGSPATCRFASVFEDIYTVNRGMLLALIASVGSPNGDTHLFVLKDS